MEDDLESVVTMERDLKAAISKKELHLFYQPLVDKKSHKIFGVEALCRWTNAQRGPISPAEFIPVAENSGIIDKIGKWVLKEALKTLKEWQDTYSRDLYLTVNVSPAQFQNKYFGKEYRRVINASGVNPRGIILEITETTAITDIEECHRQLKYLTELGVQIALDDFGSGHASCITLLKRLPLDWVKVDKSLVDDMLQRKGDFRRVQEVVETCNELGYRVIIEGIEHREQITQLEPLNYDLLQGFALYKPLARKDIESHLLLSTEWFSKASSLDSAIKKNHHKNKAKPAIDHKPIEEIE